MLGVFARNWWMLLINGVAALVFGLLAFGHLGATLQALVILFGCYCLADGFSALGSSFARNELATWWAMLFVGLISIFAGVTAVLWPGLTIRVLLVIIAAWAILRGGLEIVAGRALGKTIPSAWLLAVSGGTSILFGALLLARPGAGVLAAGRITGAFALGRGLLLCVFSLRLRAQVRRRSPAVD
jgi:uncharacterized membrane protein HdeD (DUF308 family)